MTLAILTTREVAEMTGWSTQTINRWTKNGHLPFLRKLGGGARGGYYLYDAAVVERLRTKEEAPPWVIDTAS